MDLPPTGYPGTVPPSPRPLSRRHLLVLAASALLLTAGLAGCSKDGGASPDGGSIAGLLDAVPNTKANRQYVVVNRYDAAEEGAKITPKGDDATGKELNRLLKLNQEAGIAPTGVIDTTMGPQMVGGLGFPPSDVVATVEAGTPPDTTDLAVVDTDEDDVLDEAAKVDGAERTEIDGVDVVSWLDDREIDRDLETPIGRVPGAAGRVGFAADGLLVTANSDAIEGAAIATVKGDKPSLMDDDGIAAVAGALDEEDAFTAFISGGHLGRDGSTARPGDDDGDDPALGDYSALAIGNSWSDDGLELVIAIAHDDEKTAKADAEALEAATTKGGSGTSPRLSEILADPDIERDGTTVVGTFQIEQPTLWYQFFQRLEPFFFGG